MLCALQGPRAGPVPPGAAAVLRGRLEWFTLVGPSLRPGRTWERARLELGAPRTPHEASPGCPRPSTVTCHYGTDTFQLALAPAAYTAMRSWLESSPPGFNVNVA